MLSNIFSESKCLIWQMILCPISFFFDGLFADWAVLDHINQAQSRVENTKDQIKRVLALLKKMREDVDVQIADEKEKQEQLAVETEL